MKLWTSGWLVAALAVGSTAARAEAPSAAQLQGVRLSLATYSLQDAAVLHTLPRLQALGTPRDLLAADDGRDGLRREARFLRAALTVDLLVVAQVAPDALDREALASAYGVAPERLVEQVMRDLGEFHGGVLKSPAAAAAGALALLGDTPEASAALQAQRGLRRDLLWVARLRDALESGDDPVGVLSGYGSDPCDQARSCPAPFAAFDARSRAALSVLRDAGSTLARLERAAQGGDPLSAALATRMQQAAARLRATVLTPDFVPGPELGASALEPASVQTRPDVVVLVDGAAVRIGFLPRVGLAADGSLRVSGHGQPVLPELLQIPVSGHDDGYIRPIDAVVDALKSRLPVDSRLRIAVGSGRDAASNTLARALLSVERVSGGAPLLLARAESTGALRALPVSLLHGASDQNPPLTLRVRLGGYSIKRAGQPIDIPRIQTDDGWRFDAAALQRELARARFARGSVSFMHGVACETLVTALFQVARASGDVQLQLP